jgi:hypothetical protein
MKRRYRIYNLGEVPRDLRERISEIHASAILQAKELDKTVPSPKDKPGRVAIKDTG